MNGDTDSRGPPNPPPRRGMTSHVTARLSDARPGLASVICKSESALQARGVLVCRTVRPRPQNQNLRLASFLPLLS